MKPLGVARKNLMQAIGEPMAKVEQANGAWAAAERDPWLRDPAKVSAARRAYDAAMGAVIDAVLEYAAKQCDAEWAADYHASAMAAAKADKRCAARIRAALRTRKEGAQ